MAVKKLNETTYEVSAVREGEELKHLKDHVLVQKLTDSVQDMYLQKLLKVNSKRKLKGKS